jgi:hypothetical protein
MGSVLQELRGLTDSSLKITQETLLPQLSPLLQLQGWANHFSNGGARRPSSCRIAPLLWPFRPDFLLSGPFQVAFIPG